MPVLARYPHGGEVKVTAPHPTDTPGYAPPTPQKFERLQECERIQCGQLYIVQCFSAQIEREPNPVHDFKRRLI